MINFVDKIESYENSYENTNINSSLCKMTEDAQAAVFLFPDDSLSLLFPDSKVVQEDALEKLGRLNSKLKGKNLETLSEAEDILLGNVFQNFGPAIKKERTM